MQIGAERPPKLWNQPPRFDVWTDYQKTTDNSANIKFKYFGNCDKYTMIITLSDKVKYVAYLDGQKIDFNERNKGSLEFTFEKM